MHRRRPTRRVGRGWERVRLVELLLDLRRVTTLQQALSYPANVVGLRRHLGGYLLPIRERAKQHLEQVVAVAQMVVSVDQRFDRLLDRVACAGSA